MAEMPNGSVIYGEKILMVIQVPTRSRRKTNKKKSKNKLLRYLDQRMQTYGKINSSRANKLSGEK